MSWNKAIRQVRLVGYRLVAPWHLSGQGFVGTPGEWCCVVMGTSGAVAALLMALRFPDAVSAVVADSCVETFSPDALCEEVAMRRHPLRN